MLDVEKFQAAAISQGTLPLCATACCLSVLRYLDRDRWGTYDLTNFLSYLEAQGAPMADVWKGIIDISEPMKYVSGFKHRRICQHASHQRTQCME